jgi:hypothetical protein
MHHQYGHRTLNRYAIELHKSAESLLKTKAAIENCAIAQQNVHLRLILQVKTT